MAKTFSEQNMQSSDTISNTRTNIASGSPFEPLRGFSRAVQIGNHLFISGTTAMTAQGDVAAPGDAYLQTKAALASIKEILNKRGFTTADVVRTRLFVTNIVKWDDYARAHREVFESVRPASSIVQVSKLVDPRLVIEIEVDAMRGATEVTDTSVAL
jgi:enamine deaminase RidA (YjgF/YER057c/UK114 family)